MKPPIIIVKEHAENRLRKYKKIQDMSKQNVYIKMTKLFVRDVVSASNILFKNIWRAGVGLT